MQINVNPNEPVVRLYRLGRLARDFASCDELSKRLLGLLKTSLMEAGGLKVSHREMGL